MKTEDIVNALGGVEDRFLMDAEVRPRKRLWIRWAAAAACLVLVGTGAWMLRDRPAIDSEVSLAQPGPVLPTGTGTHGETGTQPGEPQLQSGVHPDYFRDCGTEPQGPEQTWDVAAPWEFVRQFASPHDGITYDESAGVFRYPEGQFPVWQDWLPSLPDYPVFSAEGRYLADGSLFHAALYWHSQEGGMNRHLKLLVSDQENPEPQCCFELHLDENGNAVEPGVTLTERDGETIAAKGVPTGEKTLTFWHEGQWYQLTGSGEVTYEEMTALLDWFWEHPADLTAFAVEAGDRYEWMPWSVAFADRLPNFAGWLQRDAYVELKNGEPIRFDGFFVTGITPAQMENMDYRVGENGCRTLDWSIDLEPDIYDLEESLGTLESLTRAEFLAQTPPDAVTTQTRVRFTQGNALVTIYASDLTEAWHLVESLR